MQATKKRRRKLSAQNSITIMNAKNKKLADQHKMVSTLTLGLAVPSLLLSALLAREVSLNRTTAEATQML